MRRLVALIMVVVLMTAPGEVKLARHAADINDDGHHTVTTDGTGGGGFDVTPPLSNALPPWVGPSGSGVITADAIGRITIDSGSAYKAFPGMTFLEGRLHLIYRSGSAHLSAGGVIKYRTSDDLGQTWTSATTIASPTGTEDLRDPTITALSTGRLIISYHVATTGGTVAVRVERIYSDNRGLTWSSPYVIPTTFSGRVAASSPPLEMPDGRILQAVYGESGSNFSAAVLFSTDSGLTFGSQTTIATALGVRDYDEPQIRLLASGNIVCLLRTDTSPNHTWRTVSTDGGLTWSAPADVLSYGYGRPDFVEFYPSALLLFTRNGSPDFYGRWFVSWDEGATWTSPQEIDTGGTNVELYAAPVVLAPGYVAVAYSLENSSSDADMYLRYYYDGVGIGADGTPHGLGGPDLSGIDFLVGTASGLLSSEIVAGTTPGGELGGTWPSPTVDTTHSGSSHASTQAAAEATAAGALAAHVASSPPSHVHVAYETHTADGSTTTFTLDQVYDPGSVMAWNRTAGTLLGVTEVSPDKATISAAGTAADLIDFHYAASVI